MRKLFAMVVIGLGLVAGFGAMNSASACEDCMTNEVSEKNVVMTYDELMMFDEMIYDIYCERYCTNYCEDCDSYYYEECMCEACYGDCYDCLIYDYELFVEDYYELIMNIYEDVLDDLEESRIANEESNEEMIICEF